MTEWHRRIQQEIAQKLEEKGYSIEKRRDGTYSEKYIGLYWPGTSQNKFMRVDILAEKEDGIKIVQIEDREVDGIEVGFGGFTELGGILLLVAISAKETHKKLSVAIVLKPNIRKDRKDKIEEIIDRARKILTFITIETEYHA